MGEGGDNSSIVLETELSASAASKPPFSSPGERLEGTRYFRFAGRSLPTPPNPWVDCP